MVKPLTKKEEKHFDDLQANLPCIISEYQSKKEQELSSGKHNELSRELKDLKAYMLLVERGEVADIENNIEWTRQKILVLAKLLDHKAH